MKSTLKLHCCETGEDYLELTDAESAMGEKYLRVGVSGEDWVSIHLKDKSDIRKLRDYLSEYLGEDIEEEPKTLPLNSIPEMIEILKALEEGNPVQYHDEGWIDSSLPVPNFGAFPYRIKREPLEFWANCYYEGVLYYYTSEAEALSKAGNNCIRKAVHMREVMEDN